MKKIYYMLLISIISIFYANTASAADFLFLYDPPDTDWLMQNIMVPLFTPETSPFGAVSGIFLGGVLTLGGILAAYTIILGTVNTAHEGEVLGKRWSTLYMPLRTAFGIAMIMPIKSGFCTIQIIIIYLATQGIGFADKAWDTWSEDPLKGSVFISPKIDGVLSPLYSNAVKAGVCEQSIQNLIDKAQSQGSSAYESLRYSLSSSGNIGSGNLGMSTSSTTDAAKKQSVRYNFGFTDSPKGIDSVDPKAICGSFVLSGVSTVTESTATDTGSTISRPEVTSDLINTDIIKNQIFTQQSQSIPVLLQAGEKLGRSLANQTSIDIDSVATQMKNDIASYQSDLATVSNTSFQNALNGDMLEDMKKDGFVSAGAWFYKVSVAQQAINQQFGTIPVETDNALNYNSLSYIDPNIMARMQSIDGVMQKAKVQLPSNKSIDETDPHKISEVVLNKLLSTTGLLDTQYGNLSGNPLYVLSNLGQNLIFGIGAAVVAITALLAGAGFITGNWISKLFGADTALTSLVTTLTPYLSLVFALMIGPALYLGIYLPLMPFIIWTGSVIGWLVLVIEALFAGPLWAMAHMAPDADNVVGGQGQGYMLVLSLILRPILMVIGFVIALNLLIPATMFVNYFFGFMVEGVSGSNIFVEFYSAIGSLFIYAMLINNILKKVLSLIHSVPDSLLQWIGGRASQILGEYNSLESDTGAGQKGALGAAVGFSSTIGRSGQDSINTLVKNRKK